MSFDAVADYCAALGVEYIRVGVPIYEIVFLERRRKIPARCVPSSAAVRFRPR